MLAAGLVRSKPSLYHQNQLKEAMKTGGFSRFARKPGAKDAASGNSRVGGKSETLVGQHSHSNSNNEIGTWGSSGFGSGFGFDAGLEETSFGGEIVRLVRCFCVPGICIVRHTNVLVTAQ